MSHSTNRNVPSVNFCDACDLSFESKKGLYRHQSYDPKHKELLEKIFDSDLDGDEDDYVLSPKTKPKDNTKDINKTKTETKDKRETKPEDNIYSRIKCECKECNQEFRNKIALTTHSYSHNRKYLENTDDVGINSSQNMREFYITDKGGNYIEDIDEATNYSLEEIKNCYQFRKVKSFKYKITAECEYKKRTKEEVKNTKIFFNTDYIINRAIYDYGDFKQWLDFEKEIYEGYCYDFEFLGLRSIQLNIEPIKASIGIYIDLPPDLKNSKSILNIRNYKYNCLQLTITAWLYSVIDPRSGFYNHARRENNYVNNLIEPRQQNEDDFAYKIRIQKLYNINIWVYTPCGGGKVELFKPVDDFHKDRRDVRILVWGNGTTEHCALIKNIETLLDRPNKMNHKFYYCDRCTYWFDSQIKYDKHECNNSFKPEIVCPKKKHISFMNEHKRQNTKNIIIAGIECCIIEVSSNHCRYVIAEHIPIAVGYTWQGNFKHYFSPGCIKRFASDLLEIETEINFKHNKQMIFTEEDKLYHNAKNTCHICSKTCINKVRDRCHETGNYRGPACKICNLRYKQQNFIPVIFHNGSGYDFNLLYSELFEQNNDKRKVDNIPLAAGKSKMFSIRCLKSLDSYNFLAMPLDQMAKI